MRSLAASVFLALLFIGSASSAFSNCEISSTGGLPTYTLMLHLRTTPSSDFKNAMLMTNEGYLEQVSPVRFYSGRRVFVDVKALDRNNLLGPVQLKVAAENQLKQLMAAGMAVYCR